MIKHLKHKHGGTITAITHVGHQSDKNGSWWFFVGDVIWDDGSGTSVGTQIHPWSLYFDHDNDDARKEFDRFYGQLNTYLNTHGAWGGSVGNWVPYAKEGRMVVTQ